MMYTCTCIYTIHYTLNDLYLSDRSPHTVYETLVVADLVEDYWGGTHRGTCGRWHTAGRCRQTTNRTRREQTRGFLIVVGYVGGCPRLALHCNGSVGGDHTHLINWRHP